MREFEIQEWETNKDPLSLDKAKELLEDKNISDQDLSEVLKSIKIFCKVAYELYVQEQNQNENKIEEKNEPHRIAA